MKKLYFLILVSLFLAIGSSAYADTHHPIKVTLNIQAFPGFDVDKNKTDASLSGYEYQAIKGTPIKPESCNQTINIDSSTIADFEYFRFKQLIISCNAIKQFAKAMKAQTTYFPAKPDISFYSELPAMTKPLLTNNELKQLSHKTLGDYAPEINISLEMDSTAKIINDGDEIYVTLLARGDFAHDGIEDLLVKTEWYARKAFGRHTDLFIFTPTHHKAPINVYWRLNSVN